MHCVQTDSDVGESSRAGESRKPRALYKPCDLSLTRSLYSVIRFCNVFMCLDLFVDQKCIYAHGHEHCYIKHIREQLKVSYIIVSAHI